MSLRATLLASREAMKSLAWDHGLHALVFTGLVALSTLPWWSSEILPLMDYPMFLQFARVLQDYTDPSSPFFGTYTRSYFLGSLSLPLAITNALAFFFSIETAGRILLSAYSVLTPVAAAFLLRVLGLSRWNVVLLFPLMFSYWTFMGFVGFITAAPLLLAALAVTVRFFEKATLQRGLWLAAILVAISLWHTLVVMMAMLCIGALWLCWRAPDWRSRFRSLIPLAAPLGVLLNWYVSLPRDSSAGLGMSWRPLASAFDAQTLLVQVFMEFKGTDLWAKAAVLLLLLLAGLWPTRQEPTRGALWRVQNPLLVLAAIHFTLFFVLPDTTLNVEIVARRFSWPAAMFLVLGLQPPHKPWAMRLAVALCLVFATSYLVEVNRRFLVYHRETVDASRLIWELPPDSTLLAPRTQEQRIESFASRVMREIQQYATIRRGVLPSTSFAAYRCNIVRFVNGNPKPALFSNTWAASARLPELDYVLLHRDTERGPGMNRLREVKRRGAWALFAVCGSRVQPTCP